MILLTYPPEEIPEVKPVTVNVPPVLFVKVASPVISLYVPPVTKISKPPVVKPVTVNVPPVLFVKVASPVMSL